MIHKIKYKILFYFYFYWKLKINFDLTGLLEAMVKELFLYVSKRLVPRYQSFFYDLRRINID
jgi:hypothetical protein